MPATNQSLWKRTLLLALVVGLGFAVVACGGKKSMEGAGDEEQVGSVDSNTELKGEEEGAAQASFDETERARRLAALPHGSTKSGPGKLNSVTVRSGDTLWKIAERKDVYGSGWLYPLLYKANKDIIKNVNSLEAGLKLKVPRNLSSVEEEIAKEEAMTGQILDSNPSTKVAVATTKSTKVKEAKGGSHLWLWLLILLAAIGAYLWKRMKNKQAEETAAPTV